MDLEKLKTLAAAAGDSQSWLVGLQDTSWSEVLAQEMH